MLKMIGTYNKQIFGAQKCCSALYKYFNEFLHPSMTATAYIGNVESRKLWDSSPIESFVGYLGLLGCNLNLCQRGLHGSINALHDFSAEETKNCINAFFNTLFGREGEGIKDFLERQANAIDMIANVYPQSIKEIEPEYGFHFENGENIKIAETDRFILYQIVPTEPKITVNKSGKPIIIIPPYVLGSNILGFLPGESKSYAHCYANQGIPTYIRIMKNIQENEAVQLLTPEEDARDTRFFCETIKDRHGKPVTLNGYCQGGFTALCIVLSGELDGLVDALITCVSPMDGTKSEGFAQFLEKMGLRFNNLDYGLKTYTNGIKVADGNLMAWSYKLKSIENESPLVAFYRDLKMFSGHGKQKGNGNGNGEISVSKTALALNYWLNYERTDLPIDITKMSYESYNTPVAKDGTLPVKLFDRKLNFHRITEKKIKWLICYGENDDLVEPETALAPSNYIDVEVSGFPKGHVALATSWADPKSKCALHTRFEGKKGEKYRGPVLFQLELDKALSNTNGKNRG